METTARVTMARAMVARNIACIPRANPIRARIKPPATGAITIGTRRRIDCTVKPIARRCLGRASPTTAKSVGLAMLDQAAANTRATSAHGHEFATA